MLKTEQLVTEGQNDSHSKSLNDEPQQNQPEEPSRNATNDQNDVLLNSPEVATTENQPQPAIYIEEQKGEPQHINADLTKLNRMTQAALAGEMPAQVQIEEIEVHQYSFNELDHQAQNTARMSTIGLSEKDIFELDKQPALPLKQQAENNSSSDHYSLDYELDSSKTPQNRLNEESKFAVKQQLPQQIIPYNDQPTQEQDRNHSAAQQLISAEDQYSKDDEIQVKDDDDDDINSQQFIQTNNQELEVMMQSQTEVDTMEDEKEDETAGYMEQEEIVIKKGKKLKQMKQIKLREYSIQQPDYALTAGAQLVYHQERLTMIHEESCQTRTKTIAGDLLPDVVDNQEKGDQEHKGLTRPSTLQIDTPLITPEQLFDFQITNVRIFQKSDRLMSVQQEPEYIFQDMDSQLKNVNKAEIHIRKFVRNSIKRKRVTPNFKPEKLIDPPKPLYIHNIDETTIFFNSQFESGNLREAERIRDNEYNLILNFDHNTLTYSQWYFYSVRNIGKGHTVKFNINNLQKDDSTYAIGMKPFVYSVKQNKQDRTHEWQRGGHDIRYFKNSLKTKDRECAPDYDWDQELIACYEYESEDSMKLGLNTLTFSYTFQHENDTVFFSYFQPYTFSDLQDLLFVLNTRYPEEHLNNILKVQKLCDTVGGNPCPILTITNDVRKNDINLNGTASASAPATNPAGNSSNDITSASNKVPMSKKDSSTQNSNLAASYPNSSSVNNSTQNGIASGTPQKTAMAASSSQNVEEGFSNDVSGTKNQGSAPENAGAATVPEGAEKKDEKTSTGKKKQKQVIFLTSRVHPGESNSQFMVHGAIEFLLQQNDKEAQLLRDTFIFKIVPMLNPDGVIIGNYRCNMVGCDLNRRWPNPSRILHPTIYFTKKLVEIYHKENQVVLFCDMHGHSRKRNVFMYGCVSGQSEINQHKNNNLIKVLPYFLAQKNRLFSFNDCKFANEKDKDATARLVMFKHFGIINSYTLESTFYAAFNQKNQYLQSQKRKPVEDDMQIKSSELIQVGYDFCSTLIAMINSKILKRKFTVDTSLNHLYQMNQKAIKKSLSIISSKDDNATASLLGFAIANRVEPSSATTNTDSSLIRGANKDESIKRDRDEKDGKNSQLQSNDKETKASRKIKNANNSEKNNNNSNAPKTGSGSANATTGKEHGHNHSNSKHSSTNVNNAASNLGKASSNNQQQSADHNVIRSNDQIDKGSKSDYNNNGYSKDNGSASNSKNTALQGANFKKRRENTHQQPSFIEGNLAWQHQEVNPASSSAGNQGDFNFKKKVKHQQRDQQDELQSRTSQQKARDENLQTEPQTQSSGLQKEETNIGSNNRTQNNKPQVPSSATAGTHSSQKAAAAGTSNSQQPQPQQSSNHQKPNRKQSNNKQAKSNQNTGSQITQQSAKPSTQNTAPATNSSNQHQQAKAQSVSPSKRVSRSNNGLNNQNNLNTSQSALKMISIEEGQQQNNQQAAIVTSSSTKIRKGNKNKNKSKTVEKHTSAGHPVQQPGSSKNQESAANNNLVSESASFILKKQNINLVHGQQDIQIPVEDQGGHKVSRVKQKKVRNQKGGSAALETQKIPDQHQLRQSEDMVGQNYKNHLIEDAGACDLSHQKVPRNAYSQFQQAYQPKQQKEPVSATIPNRTADFVIQTSGQQQEEEDPFFYHLDLSQYQDTLETHHADDHGFQLKEARLNSDRSSDQGNQQSLQSVTPLPNDRYKPIANDTQMPMVGAGIVPRLKVPVGMGQYTQELTRKSLNLPNEQFLISGGSIDKYLKNHVSSPTEGKEMSPKNQQAVPVMSNLIIAMALQNNYTPSAQNHDSNQNSVKKQTGQSTLKQANFSQMNQHQNHDGKIIRGPNSTQIHNQTANNDMRSTPYSNQINSMGPLISSQGSQQQQQMNQLAMPQQMTPSARALQGVNQSHINEAINHIMTNDQAFAY